MWRAHVLTVCTCPLRWRLARAAFGKLHPSAYSGLDLELALRTYYMDDQFTERDPLIAPSGQPAAPPLRPGPASYPEPPPPYTTPPPHNVRPHPPPCRTPPPPYAQPHPPYTAPPPPQYPSYSSTNVTVIRSQTTCAARQAAVHSKPNSYIILSAVVILCGCWICGLVALIFALMVDSAWASGDYVEAKQNAKMAKWCGLAGIISAIVFYVVVIVIVTVVTTLAT